MEWRYNQPATIGDLSFALRVPPQALRRLLDAHDIPPAFRAGRVRLYDRDQIDAIADLVRGRCSSDC